MSTRSFLSEDLARSDRPPTYTSNTGDSDTASVIDPHARVRSWRGSMLSSPPLLIPDEQQSQYGTDMDSVASSPLPRESESHGFLGCFDLYLKNEFQYTIVFILQMELSSQSTRSTSTTRL